MSWGDGDSISVPSKLPPRGRPAQEDFDGPWRDEFTVIRLLGQGGFGRVLLVREYASKTECALKHPWAEPPEASARFRREIAELTKARHDHIMPVRAVGAGDAFYTMPVASTTLKAAVLGGMFPGEQLAAIRGVVLGLHHAHRNNLIHRDVTPKNILALPMPEGLRWVLADFGLVRRLKGPKLTTLTHGAVGTEGYMAPEMFGNPEKVDARADVYSLGRTIGFMLTGMEPEVMQPSFGPAAWLPLLERMTERHADERLSLPDVLEELDRVEKRLRVNVTTSLGQAPTSAQASVSLRARTAVLCILENGAPDPHANPEEPWTVHRATVWHAKRSLDERDPRASAAFAAGTMELLQLGLLAHCKIEMDQEMAAGLVFTKKGWEWVRANADELFAPSPSGPPSAPSPPGPVTDNDIPF